MELAMTQAGLFPSINWELEDLEKEWERFARHCSVVFGGLLASVKEEPAKVNHLMTFVGDKGRSMATTFAWATEKIEHGTPDTPDKRNEEECLHCVMLKFKAHVEGKRNPIRAALLFDQRKQRSGETFNTFVTDLKLLVKGIDIEDQAVRDKLVRNAIACRSLDSRVRSACLERKGDLTLQEAVRIGLAKESSKETSVSYTHLTLPTICSV